MCQIKYHSGFSERRECLDENKNLSIATILVCNLKGKCERRDKWERTLKKGKNPLWEGKRSQTGQRKKETQRIKYLWG